MRGFQGTRWSAISHVEAEQHDVAILRYILFALRTQLACVTRTCLAIMADIIFISDGLSPDEAAFEIAVNGACSLRGFLPLLYGPGARPLWPYRGERE